MRSAASPQNAGHSEDCHPFLHHPDAAAEPPRPRHHVVAQLVAVVDHRQVYREVLERVVAGVGHQAVDTVGAVRGGPSAVGALVHLEEHPVLAVRLEPGVGGEGEGRGVAGDDVVRQHRRERLVDEVDDAVDLGEPRFRRGREVGVVDGAFRGDRVDFEFAAEFAAGVEMYAPVPIMLGA